MPDQFPVITIKQCDGFNDVGENVVRTFTTNKLIVDAWGKLYFNDEHGNPVEIRLASDIPNTHYFRIEAQ